MRVSEFEDAVYATEGVRLVVRAPANTDVDPYDYQRAGADRDTITEWLERRIVPLVGQFQIAVIDGNGEQPHGRTKMVTVRASYVR